MFFFLSKRYELTPTTNTPAVTKPERTVWKNLLMAVGESSTAQKSIISFRAVSGLNCIPTGSCIQALATRIHSAERLDPTATIQAEVR